MTPTSVVRRLHVVAALIIAIPSFQEPGLAMGQEHRGFRSLKVHPVDEAKLDPTLVETREKLLRAIRDRDAERVVGLIHLSLHRDLFVDHLRRGRTFAGGEESSAWVELERALSLGGAFTTTKGAAHGRREFCAPYAYVNWPAPVLLHEMTDPDSGEPWIVIGQGVAVRRAPSIKASVIARVSYEVLPVDARSAPDESGARLAWQRVTLPDGRSGFVANSFLWSDLDYHACFANVEGQWLLTKFKQGWY